MTKMLSLLALLPVLAGCSVYREATTSTLPHGERWQSVATDADRDRIRRWRSAWTEALPLARQADARAIAADPLLYDPDRALSDAAPPQGDYRCRTIKLGGLGTGTRNYTAYPHFACRIADEGEVKSFRKLTGSQRPTGLLYPSNTSRTIFLGTLVLGDESAPLRYGTDRDRDMIGYFERIGERRWRLVLPRPRFESILDIIEIVPA